MGRTERARLSSPLLHSLPLVLGTEVYDKNNKSQFLPKVQSSPPPLTHVKEKLPQSLHPALQGSPTLCLKGVSQLVLPILVTDAQCEGPACRLLQLPCSDSSLLQEKERGLLPIPPWSQKSAVTLGKLDHPCLKKRSL